MRKTRKRRKRTEEEQKEEQEEQEAEFQRRLSACSQTPPCQRPRGDVEFLQAGEVANLEVHAVVGAEGQVVVHALQPLVAHRRNIRRRLASQ